MNQLLAALAAAVSALSAVVDKAVTIITTQPDQTDVFNAIAAITSDVQSITGKLDSAVSTAPAAGSAPAPSSDTSAGSNAGPGASSTEAGVVGSISEAAPSSGQPVASAGPVQ
jgi:hypothetical protein